MIIVTAYENAPDLVEDYLTDKSREKMQNLKFMGGTHTVFQSEMVIDPDRRLVGDLDAKVYRVVDAREFYEADDELCLSAKFVRKLFGIRTKKAIIQISRGKFEGAQDYYLESDGTITEYFAGWSREESQNWPISFTFEEYLGRITGKTVTRGKPRTRKKFWMAALKG